MRILEEFVIERKPITEVPNGGIFKLNDITLGDRICIKSAYPNNDKFAKVVDLETGEVLNALCESVVFEYNPTISSVLDDTYAGKIVQDIVAGDAFAIRTGYTDENRRYKSYLKLAKNKDGEYTDGYNAINLQTGKFEILDGIIEVAERGLILIIQSLSKEEA